MVDLLGSVMSNRILQTLEVTPWTFTWSEFKFEVWSGRMNWMVWFVWTGFGIVFGHKVVFSKALKQLRNLSLTVEI